MNSFFQWLFNYKPEHVTPQTQTAFVIEQITSLIYVLVTFSDYNPLLSPNSRGIHKPNSEYSNMKEGGFYSDIHQYT